ncbi:MAG: hypothetical protein ABII80_02660 [bacterium]
MKNITIILVILGLVIGGISFYGGTLYQKGRTPSFADRIGFTRPGASGQQGGTQGRQAGFSGNRPISGEVISSDATTLTLKLSDGSSKIVLLSDKTVINKTEATDISVLTPGVSLTVFGASNPDGSISADNINLGQAILRMPEASPASN